MILKFYKNMNDKWMLDLPQWHGDKSDLEMIGDSAHIFDTVTVDKKVAIEISEQPLENTIAKMSYVKKINDGEAILYNFSYVGKATSSKPAFRTDVMDFLFGGNYPQVLFMTVAK